MCPRFKSGPSVDGTTHPRRREQQSNGTQTETPTSRVLRTIRELSRLRERLEVTTPVGFTITRSAGGHEQQIVYASPGFSALTGYKLAEVINRDCRLLQRGDRKQAGRATLREAIAARREATVLLRNYRKNGEMFWNELFVAPLHGTSEAENLFLGVQHDVTARQHSAELLGSHPDLPDVLAKTLDEQERYKHEFLSVISHELRTPVQSILGFTELLSDAFPVQVDPLLKQCITGLHSETHRMQNLIDNLLLTSQMITGTLVVEPAPIDYGALLQAVIETMTPAAKRKGIEIRTSLNVPHEIPLDGGAIQKVLTNLLDNAIKFAPDNTGYIDVHAHVTGNALITRIRNPTTPHAFPSKTRLFHPFVQGDMGIRRPIGGLGLGLCVSKTLVEGHGGTLSIAHTPHHGCILTFQIPIPPRVRPLTLHAGYTDTH